MNFAAIKEYRKNYLDICETDDERNLGELPVIDWLIREVETWQEKFHDRCDIQLDECRKDGMTEAAMRCAEIAENTFNAHHIGKCAGDIVAVEIRKEFSLPTAG